MSTDRSPWDPSTPQAACYVDTTPPYTPFSAPAYRQPYASGIWAQKRPYQFPFQVPGYLMRNFTSNQGFGTATFQVPFGRQFQAKQLSAHPMMYHGRGSDRAMVKNSRSPLDNPNRFYMDRNIMYSFT